MYETENAPEQVKIIERHGARKINNGYIFNVIPVNATEKDMLQKVRFCIAGINISLKKIAGKVGVSKQLDYTDIKTT